MPMITQEQLSKAITQLTELGDRLENAHVGSANQIREKDWFICAHAANLLSSIRYGLDEVEAPYLHEKCNRGPLDTERGFFHEH